MKLYRRFYDWLFRFASSQENIDRVAVLFTFVTATAIAITIVLRIAYLVGT